MVDKSLLRDGNNLEKLFHAQSIIEFISFPNKSIVAIIGYRNNNAYTYQKIFDNVCFFIPR